LAAADASSRGISVADAELLRAALDELRECKRLLAEALDDRA
jgi:hypothetical protein